MSDALQPPARTRKTAKVFTVAEAREALLAKLEKAGAKGTVSLFSAAAPAAKRAALEEALAALEAEREIFRDARKGKPRFFLWRERPVLPTAEAVAGKLESFAMARFPVLAALADFAAAVKANREEKALAAEAVALLVKDGRLVRLLQRSARTMKELYVASAPLGLKGSGPARAVEFVAEGVRAAYQRLVEQTGFPDVAISALQQESGAALAELKEWLLEQHQAGRAVLSFGDWSLADAARREAAIELHGDQYLLLRLLT